jgi:hypothetical protein
MYALPDPPYVQGGWAIAQFKLGAGATTPAEVVSSVTVNTTGVQTNPNCVAAVSATVTPVGGGGSNFSMAVTAPNGFGSSTNGTGPCNDTVTFDGASATQQYGVQGLLNCATGGAPAAQTNATFQPVVFWFFHDDAGGAGPQGAAVLCAPTLTLANVQAGVLLNNMTAVNVSQIDSSLSADSITNSPQNGRAFNGYVCWVAAAHGKLTCGAA